MKESLENNSEYQIQNNHPKLLDLKNDYVFKRVFGHRGSEKITKSLINSIIETPVDSVDLDCKTI